MKGIYLNDLLKETENSEARGFVAVHPSDFDKEMYMSDVAGRMVTDRKFDRMCGRNIESREKCDPAKMGNTRMDNRRRSFFNV